MNRKERDAIRSTTHYGHKVATMKPVAEVLTYATQKPLEGITSGQPLRLPEPVLRTETPVFLLEPELMKYIRS